MLNTKTPLEKEWKKITKREQEYLRKNAVREESHLGRLLEDKIPDNLQNTLDAAFYKAFSTVFDKGTGIIEKTYSREKLQNDYKTKEYASKLTGKRKELRAFSRTAKGKSAMNTLISGVSGVGLGVLGVGLPDILLLTGMILKNIYEIALHYGYDYETDEERKFILLVIQGALSGGRELVEINEEVNTYIEKGKFVMEKSTEAAVQDVSECLSGELLYMKFLQGIPVAGVIGGAYDAVYMRRIAKYADLKYGRRFFSDRIK